MPHIALLKVNQFRNLTEVHINPHPKFNFFFGKNGAGKTNLLESIYYLSVGRSFRTHITQCLLQNDTNRFSIFVMLKKDPQSIPLGVERNRSGDRHLKLDGEIVPWSSVAKQLPLCVLSAKSYRFLLDGPKIRRQFLDWLLFHAEPSFFPVWQRVQHLLKQRNAALKGGLPPAQITYWDKMLVEDAEQLHQLRQNLTTELTPLLNEILNAFLPGDPLNTGYFRGWSEKYALSKQLQANLEQDLRRGYTQAGPQRADFRLTIRNFPVQDILSQGQQKLVTYALYFAQGVLLKKKTNINPIFLIDDLPAELDANKRKCVINLLSQLQSQVFISGINPCEINLPHDSGMFHIEHGTVTRSSYTKHIEDFLKHDPKGVKEVI